MTSRAIKQFIAAGGAALVLGGSVLGIAAAQQTPTPTAPGAGAAPTRPANVPGQQGTQGQDQRQQLLNRVASKLGVSVDRLEQAFTEARQELGIPEGPRFAPRGHGPGRGFDLSAAAQALNLQPQQLRQELSDRSLTDVARARNVDPTTVANALKAQASQRIDQAATAGRIPADQVAAAKQRANQHVDELMTRPFPAAPAAPGPRARSGAPSVPASSGPVQLALTPGPRV